MRLWTLHPRYLDTKGLLAAWREALLAQKVLQGRTKGYRRHPQLIRFKTSANPLGSIACYLKTILAEAQNRNYHFNACKIQGRASKAKIAETRGQLLYEWQHLIRKIKTRAPGHYALMKRVRSPQANPLFLIRKGPIGPHEKV